MAAQIITIAIEKGGAGKTVTASNLAYLMGDEGKKVLCIDTDPQGNLTSALSGGNGITSGVYNGRALFEKRVLSPWQEALFRKGNTAQFPPNGSSTAPAAAARHLRCQNAR